MKIRPANRSEMLRLLDLKDKTCAEIGVFRGDFALEIYSHGPESLNLIDPWSHQPEELRRGEPEDVNFLFEQVFTTIRLLFEDKPNVCLMKMLSAQAANVLEACSEKSPFDFIYIDGNHAYDFIKQDLNLWWPKIKSGGVLAGHDYGPECPDVVRAVNEFAQEQKIHLAIETLDQKEYPSFGFFKP